MIPYARRNPSDPNIMYVWPIFGNQPNEIYIHLSEKASKGRFLKLDKLQNHSNEAKKERARRRKGEEEKKNAMIAFLVFINYFYFGDHGF